MAARLSIYKDGRGTLAKMAHGPNHDDRGVPESKRDPRLDAAETWLANQADDPAESSDQEALIYLRSRDRDCHKQVTDLIASWKGAEDTRMDEFIQRRGPASTAHQIIIEETSQFELPDFWETPSLGEYSCEASMLRAARWCDIPGFDGWWRRLANRSQENLLRGGIEESTQAAYWLFNMLRSDYAMELMPEVLKGYSQSIGLAGSHGRAPWIIETDGPNNADLHIALASTIIFAHSRLMPNAPRTDQLRLASDAICKCQAGNGAWPALGNDPNPSIESTAMVLHALALAKPRSWSRISVTAREWLWSVQGPDGSWNEAEAPDPAYLTVLVLDAIALTNGETKLTFGQRMGPDALALDSADDRIAAVQNYIDEVLRQTGKRISMAEIWKKAGYRSRTEFERWKRKDPRATEAAGKNISRILQEKPHLK